MYAVVVPKVTNTSIPNFLFLKSLSIPKKNGPPARTSMIVANDNLT